MFQTSAVLGLPPTPPCGLAVRWFRARDHFQSGAALPLFGKIKTGDKWTPRVLAGCMVLAWFSIEGFLLHQAFRGGPEPSSSMSQIVGAISRMADAAVSLVLGYYFGSSAGRDHSTGLEQGK